MFAGKPYDNVKKKVQFLMDENKHEAKKKNTFDVKTSIKAAVNVIFTQMQEKQVFKLFGERAVAYTLRYVIYIGEPLSNTIPNYHGTFIHIYMH